MSESSEPCQRFESNIFRRERCKHCGKQWHMHPDAAFEASQLAHFQAQVNRVSAAPPTAKSKAKARATGAPEWLYEGEDVKENSSGSEDAFRMFAGQELDAFTRSSSTTSAVKIVNLVDFEECNVASPRTSEASSASSLVASTPRPVEGPAVPAGAAAPGFTMPMRSKNDVLLEEIQFLRQMLADANEEKRIQVAIIRDEVVEKQRLIDELRRQTFTAEARLQAMPGLEVGRIESLEADLELATAQVASLHERCRELESAGQLHEAESLRLKGKLDFWEVPDSSLADVKSEPAVLGWESALREACQSSLQRLADRRVALRVASYKEVAVCKICYDWTASCALLPCRHHAFCSPCAERVEQSREQACPICRTVVTGRFETYSG
ncbi:unnamed protein product [Durusdinium trenchii]|uniref:Chloroplastic n=2 Tax=Durusdinium trenchii TaxID=1381693 RepID=A0ABP0H9L0_9DINO